VSDRIRVDGVPIDDVLGASEDVREGSSSGACQDAEGEGGVQGRIGGSERPSPRGWVSLGRRGSRVFQGEAVEET
jgi:hypothetical protein